LIERTFGRCRREKGHHSHVQLDVARARRVVSASRRGNQGHRRARAQLIQERLHRLRAPKWRSNIRPKFQRHRSRVREGNLRAVMDVWQPTPQRKMILTCPTRWKSRMPNVYADQIEWICPQHQEPRSLIISLHTHNDRFTGVAASELGLSRARTAWKARSLAMAAHGNLDIVTSRSSLHARH